MNTAKLVGDVTTAELVNIGAALKCYFNFVIKVNSALVALSQALAPSMSAQATLVVVSWNTVISPLASLLQNPQSSHYLL